MITLLSAYRANFDSLTLQIKAKHIDDLAEIVFSKFFSNMPARTKIGDFFVSTVFELHQYYSEILHT